MESYTWSISVVTWARLPESLVSLWEEHDRHNREPDQEKFSTVLHDVIGSYTGDRIFLIFDALDECPDNEVHERDLLFRILKDLLGKHRKKIHLLATSRFEENIRQTLDLEGFTIDLEHRMNDDVETFVNNALDQGKLSRWKEETGEPRRFLWADLQIKRLEKCKNESQIKKSLDKIPKTLQETYQRILDDIPQGEHGEARLILTWLSFSLAPLTPADVAAAVDYSHPEYVVETCTTYLVNVSPSNGTIKLAHFSVKEFLVSAAVQKINGYPLTAIDGHLDIANCALDELLKQTKALTKQPAHDLPLLNYAADYWDAHFSELTEPMVYLNWRSVALCDFSLDSWDPGYSAEPPIYLACKMGIPKIASCIVESVDLTRASCEEAETFLDMLLSLETLYNKPANGFVLLNEDIFTAAARNRESGNRLMCLLLDRQDKLEVPATERVLQAVVSNTRCGEEIMRILLDRRRNDIQITEALMRTVADNYKSNPGILTLVLQNFGSMVPLNQQIFISFVKRAPVEVVELLLRICGNEIQITEQMLVAAANSAHWKNGALFSLLRKRMAGIEITSELLQPLSFYKNGFECMKLLLAKCHQGLYLEYKLIHSVARKGSDDPMMRMLATMKAAYRKFGFPRQMIDLVRNNPESEIAISEKILCSVVYQNREKSALEYLLELDKNLPITEEVLVSAAMNDNIEALEFLFNKFPSVPVTDRLFKTTMGSRNLLPLWLKQGHHVQGYRIIGSLLEQNRLTFEELIKLLDQGLIEICDDLVDAVGTQEALVMAFGRHHAMEKLLNLRSVMKVTEEVVLKTLDKVLVDLKAFQMLTDRLGSAMPVTQQVLEHAFLNDQYRLFDLLLKEVRDFNPQKIWNAICRTISRNNQYRFAPFKRLRKAANALLKYGEFDLSQALLEFLPFRNENGGFVDFMDLYELNELCAEQDLSAPVFIQMFIRLGSVVTTEKAWDALWQNDYCSFKEKVMLSNALLQYTEYDASPILLNFFLIRRENEGFYDEDLDELVNLFTEQDIAAPATNVFTEILFDLGDTHHIKKFIIKRKPAIHITEDLYRRAEENEWAYKKTLMPFLNSRRAANQKLEIAQAQTEAEEA
ncbi:hypothetical protein BO71DRAFT_419092 [Aspergillus ellipticus CBS 707.79]|uniref:Nephrocystin 3-like N-terminal domain-containing protein n=1 Tax=Aspergillus ellipticus CBS 707.79 TaxID=1448320 RepID=A0A319DBI1_9EURO|nr:hypothetical protein BO71DRAFT_419092 [Aspergillus ellipticus CBS 707.79]